MKITMKCPNCFREVSTEDRYCIYCGCDLTDAEDVMTAAALGGEMSGGAGSRSEAEPGKDVPEEDLPECGWICQCGAYNEPELHFCTTCGRPRGWRPDPEKEEGAIPLKKPAVIPEGMYEPGEDDLRVKSRYGN